MSGKACLGVLLDVSDPKAVAGAVGRVENEFGRTDFGSTMRPHNRRACSLRGRIFRGCMESDHVFSELDGPIPDGAGHRADHAAAKTREYH